MSLPIAPKYLVVVVGPTAVGKTSLCIQLAQHLRTEIVSADARQLYHGMRIGTAQPTTEEMQGIPHYFIDFLPVQAAYSAGMFERNALKLLDHLFLKYDHVLMTGGSGLYIQAICEGLDAMPPTDHQIRATLNIRLKEEGLAALAKELLARDPTYYQIVDHCNPQRIIRALEIVTTTGKPYTAFRQHVCAKRSFKIIKVGLICDRQELYQRINQRTDQMIAQGLVEEATVLYPYKAYNALQTLGYREIFSYLAGHCDQEEAIRLLKRNTRRYAKRQLTWFRRDQGIRWFHSGDFTATLSYIKQVIKDV